MVRFKPELMKLNGRQLYSFNSYMVQFKPSAGSYYVKVCVLVVSIPLSCDSNQRFVFRSTDRLLDTGPQISITGLHGAIQTKIGLPWGMVG